MKVTKRLSIFLVVLLLLGVLSGCGQKQETPVDNEPEESEVSEEPAPAPAPKKDTITIAQNETVNVLDPHDTNQIVSFTAQRQIFDTLVYYDAGLNLKGGLATEWTNLSDTEWEFKLRKGVKWHDGSDFTAEDVKFSIERQKTIPRNSYRVASISEIEIVDDYTIILRTAEPDGSLLINLPATACAIVPKKAVTEMGEEFAKKPVGTGPMKVVKWVPGEELILEKNKDYFEDNSESAEKMIFVGIPEGTSRTIALETGEVDVIIGVEAIDKAKVESNPDLVLHQVPIPRVDYFSFNVTKKPFDNKLVRQAISHAIDKESINAVVNDGRCVIANTVVGPPTIGFNADLNLYDYNPEKAKELLKEAGFPDGFSMTIWSSSDFRERIAQIIQANLAEIGITADIDVLEFASYVERTGAGEHQTFVLGWSADGDGDLALYPQFHSSSHGPTGNRSFYTNKEVDKLLEEARKEVNLEARGQKYYHIQELIMEDAPWVPLYYPTLDVGARADLKDLEPNPLGQGSTHFYKVHY